MTGSVFSLARICILCATYLIGGTPIWAVDSADVSVDDRELNRSVEMDGLVIPVFSGRLLENYLFASARIVVGPGRDTWKYREKAHLIRDALLLAAHKTSLHVDGDIHHLDLDRAEKICLGAANAAIGEEDALTGIIFTRIVSKLGFSR